MKKVTIIGAGNVGSHVANALIMRNLAAEIFLIDTNDSFESAQVLDIRDALLFHPFGKIRGADFGDPEISDSDLVIITAGANQVPGETRCNLLERNKKILRDIKISFDSLKKSAIVLLISNPVDILTQVASEIFDLPWGQVFGTGTLLDSARLRWRLAEKLRKNIRNTHGLVLGEHGDSEFVAWSTVLDAGKISPEDQIHIEESVRNEAYEIIEGKGATFFGIAAATAEIVTNIFADSKVVLPVSVPLRGEYDISDIALGVPAIIGSKGVERVVEREINNAEKDQLRSAAQKLKDLLKESCEV